MVIFLDRKIYHVTELIYNNIEVIPRNFCSNEMFSKSCLYHVSVIINNFDQNHVYRVFILEFSLNYTKKRCFVLLINICVPCFIRFTITNNTFNKLIFLPNLHVPLVRYDFIGRNVSLCIIDFKDKQILKSK